jgi:hypothetical protein
MKPEQIRVRVEFDNDAEAIEYVRVVNVSEHAPQRKAFITRKMGSLRRLYPLAFSWSVDILSPGPVSWAPEVVADSSGKWCGNALRFATQDEALASARDLMARWYLVTDCRAVPSADPVTYRMPAINRPRELVDVRSGAVATCNNGSVTV